MFSCPHPQLLSLHILFPSSPLLPPLYPQHLAAFEFLGRLIGVALRTGVLLPLDLPALFWKPLVGDAPDRADLFEIDASVAAQVRRLEAMRDGEAADEAEFEEGYGDLEWSVTRADGSTVALSPSTRSSSSSSSSSSLSAAALGAATPALTLSATTSASSACDGTDADTGAVNNSSVPFARRREWVALAIHARLHEADAQVAAVKRGMRAPLG
jgi:hypothetical protein